MLYTGTFTAVQSICMVVQKFTKHLLYNFFCASKKKIIFVIDNNYSVTNRCFGPMVSELDSRLSPVPRLDISI